mmetsp:Transcript_13710/g.40488  ORF Transcript_13710/g.40488 Transcript_13710/m.40488 type:complete len:205 (-) Transcript_13710:1686-2300(-)
MSRPLIARASATAASDAKAVNAGSGGKSSPSLRPPPLLPRPNMMLPPFFISPLALGLSRPPPKTPPTAWLSCSVMDLRWPDDIWSSASISSIATADLFAWMNSLHFRQHQEAHWLSYSNLSKNCSSRSCSMSLSRSAASRNGADMKFWKSCSSSSLYASKISWNPSMEPSIASMGALAKSSRETPALTRPMPIFSQRPQSSVSV